MYMKSSDDGNEGRETKENKKNGMKAVGLDRHANSLHIQNIPNGMSSPYVTLTLSSMK